MINASPFHDPLKDWPNDDLLVTQAGRDRMTNHYPHLLKIFHWQDLCDKFEFHNNHAQVGKSKSRRQGTGSILLSGIGVILLSISQGLPLPAKDFALTIALVFMLVGGVIGVLNWGFLRSRHAWMGHRYWAERLRQLHFQLLVNNLDLAARAITDDAAMDELARCRQRWLSYFYIDSLDPRARIREIIDDHLDKEVWLRTEWRTENVPSNLTPQLAEIIDGLNRSRIGIQAYFAKKNLGDDIYSPTLRAKILAVSVNCCFAVVAILALFGIVSAISDAIYNQIFLGLSAETWTIVSAIVSAMGLMAQTLNQGLQNDAELDRYQWYAKEIEEIEESFNVGDVRAKVEALRRLERASYRELRLFLRTHKSARFN